MPKRDTPKIAAPSSASRHILNGCLTGDTHPALGLVRLLDELGSVEAVADLIGEAVATGHPVAAELEGLLLDHRDACERITSMLRHHPAPAPPSPPGTAVDEIRRFFDRAVRQDEVASVAAYSLGSPELLEQATEEILVLLDRWGLLDPDRSALEIGCGIGRVLAALAPRLAEIHGIDVSPGMVAAARRRCAGLANVHLAECSGLDLAGFPDARFDLVLAVDSLPYIHQGGPDLVEAHFREVARVLRPGGDFAILNFSYRSDLQADCEEVEELAERHGLFLEAGGFQPFAFWDGIAFLCRRLPELR
ncbi:MAG TPA: class I SAM-dependent methyltransferase [Thermoanaerobaculia bacterium]|nr:class I SAM-dependent methyltransferase [Thermoanaerobaculia bacterium]